MKISDLHVFLATENIPTCPICGSRTQFLPLNPIADLHVCNGVACGEIFIVEQDPDEDLT